MPAIFKLKDGTIHEGLLGYQLPFDPLDVVELTISGLPLETIKKSFWSIGMAPLNRKVHKYYGETAMAIAGNWTEPELPTDARSQS